MKLSVIITTILVAQVSASFFDVFHGAVLSVQNSFGKLLSDVVTDVKETVDCTILAVEHILSFSNDATTRYYEKCGSVTNQTDSVSETRQDGPSAPKVELTFNLPNNSEYLLKMIPAEIDARINETLSKVLDNYKSHDNVLSIENVLAKQSDKLAGVSVLVKKELDKLSHEVTTDLKEMEKQRDSEPSVDTILQEKKVLEKREQNTKNTLEASEIHQVIVQVLGKLDAIEATEANENNKLEVILKDLESNSNNSFVSLRQQFEKSKIDEHEKMFDYPESFNRHGFESPTTVGSSEVATLPTNQSKPLQNNLTRNNMNECVTNATLGIINNAHVNKTIPPVDLLADLNKQESSSVTANEPTNVLSTNENNLNGTVIVSNPLQPPKITAIKDAILPGKRNTDSGKQKTSDSAINNDTVIINAAETAGIDMTSTSQSNNNSNDTLISSTGNTMVENTSVNATSSENVKSSTSATSEVVATLATFHVIASNDTILTSTLSYINFSTPVNVTIVPTESSTATVNDKSSTVTAELISDDSNNTMLLSTSSPNLESTLIYLNPQVIDLLADLNKQESSSVTANEPTNVLSTNENNSNGTVIVCNPLQPPEITSIKDAILPGKRNTDSRKQETSDSAINNDTVIIPETAGIEMTSTSQSNNNSNDTLISSTGNTMVETTSVNATSSENVESSTSATSEVVATLATFHTIASNDTILTSTLSYINFSTPVNVTIVPTESSTATVNDKSSTVTAELISDDSNNTMLPSTSSPNLESTLISETIESKETTLASGKDQSITKSYNPIITSTSLPTVKNIPGSVSVKPEETGTTSDYEKSSTLTTKIFNDNDSNNTIITTVSLPIVETTSVSGTVEPKETATVSGNEEFSKDLIGTMITSTSLPIIESSLLNKTIQPDETTTASSNKEFSTETTSQLTTTSKIANENDSHTTITSTPNPIISMSESETIQAIDITIVCTSDEESLGSIANSPTGTPNAAGDDDDSSAAVVTMTPEAISESIPQKNVTAAENDETSASTTNSPIASPATLIDPDSNTDVITSTAFPSAEITTVREVIEPVKSTASTENAETSVSSTTPVTIILDKVTNENTDTIDTVTTTTKNPESAVVTKIIQTDEISTASEEQELSSTSTTTQSAIIMTTSTVFPPTESITASGNEEDLKNSPTLEANTSRTPDILNSPDLDVRSPPLTITESVPVNREWLTTNTHKQKNYNTNETPRNNYEFNAPISLSDPLLQTGQPLIDPEDPTYGQAVPPITRSLFNGAPKFLTPNRLIPNAPNQQPKIENVELQQAAFELFDTADKQSSHSDSPFGPEEIPKIANIPSPPLITNTPRNPIDPQRMNYEDPSYVPTPKNPISPPYSFDNRAPATTYKPQSLTTERPKITTARANKYKSPPYDSFFHRSPKNSEAHQRALKEARQLMANSKRAERIINNIMKNRNKFNARSVLG